MSVPLAAIERVARRAGVDRISAGAIRELQRTLGEIGLELAMDAAEAARHAGRKTITKDDVFLVSGKRKV
jgi:histone H3/H4